MKKQPKRRGPEFYRYLARLTAPIALQNLITFSLGLIDTFMVSQLGNLEMAAVTTANVPVFLLISIVFGIQSGVGILISQYWGKQDKESISRAIGVAAFIGTGISLLLALILFAWPVQIMDLLSNKHELSVLGAPYLRVIGFSYVFNMLSSIYVSAQRSVENAAFGMKLFGMSTLLNTGLNYLLIFGKAGFPMLGIEGAAVATLCARIAEFLVCSVCALRSRTIPLNLAAFCRPGWDMLRRFVKYSTPVILNETAWGLGNSMLTVILGYTTISVEFLAANAVMGNLNRLFLVVCFGLGAATAVMVGKAIGEGQSREEVLELSYTLLRVTVLVGCVLMVFSLALVPLLFRPVIFPLFKLYGETASIATALAVTGFASIPLHAYSITAVTGVLRAGGDVFWSAAFDIGPQWLAAEQLLARRRGDSDGVRHQGAAVSGARPPRQMDSRCHEIRRRFSVKCTVLFASPRGEASNTLAVTRPVTDALTQAGWEVERFSLYDMDIQPCRACRGCQRDWEHPACILRDDMQPIFESVLSADLLLLASPIYSWYCTAPLKAALDRMVYAMNKYYGDQGRGPSLWRGRAVAAVTTCGYRPERGADLWEEGLRRYCKHSQLRWLGMLSARHLGYSVPFMDGEKAAQARAFAAELLAAMEANPA